MSGTRIESLRGSPADLHALDLAEVVGGSDTRGVFVLESTSSAVVLGSTQPDDHVSRARAASAGVDVVRRRSGGGAVWVTPGDPIWIDIWIPRTDPLWRADVGRAFDPVGAAMAQALRSIRPRTGAPLPELAPHVGPMIRTESSAQVCFAGVGPGEVLWRGRKLVGISQRRTRDGARFQCAMYRHWDPDPLHGLLVDGPGLRELLECGAGLDSLGIAAVNPENLAEVVAAALTDNVG